MSTTLAHSLDPELLARLTPATERDPHFMREALAQARLAYGRTSPNPMVGSVIVAADGAILGRGFHRRAGADHGEIAALKDARRNGHDPRGATLYVNLEPCSFHGRTPPCADACVEAGLARVVVGVVDPHPRVSGQGIARLLAAGVAVTCWVLEGDCRRLNAPFFTQVLHQRPHVTAKVAMSLDGKIATRSGDSFPLTGAEARERVHMLRDRIDAILVGRRTAALDNPRLTCRVAPERAAWGGPRAPPRIILDPELRLPLDLQVFQLQAHGQSDAPTLLVVDEDTAIPRDHQQALDDLGVSVIGSPRLGDGRLDVPAMLKQLVDHNINSVLIEGGGTTLALALAAGCVDAWIAHVAPVLIGGAEAPTPLDGLGAATLADAIRLTGARVTPLGQDVEIAAPVAGDVYGLD